MIITYIYLPENNHRYRVQVHRTDLADAIDRTGQHRAYLLKFQEFIENTSHAQEICEASDIIVIHRYLLGMVLKVVQYWKARDKKILVDFNEAFDLISPEMPAYSFWMKGNIQPEFSDWLNGGSNTMDPAPLEQFKWGMHLVDAATVPSIRLAHDWQAFTKVFLVPDYLNVNHYLTVKQNHHDEIRIGLSGEGFNPASLFSSGVASALEQVCLRRSNVKVIFSNVPSDVLEKINIVPDQLEVYSQASFDKWVQVLSGLDLGVAPVDGDYDLRMGSFNVMEFMVMKIPWAASNTLPYRDLARYGWLVPNSVNNWESSLLELIDHIDAYRAEAVGEPFLFALSQDINENISKVIDIYNSILLS
ncbi:MAG: hypothetical protein P4L50_30920 [Anaerolineaceae bacterium]|nr:hypothetical protein [Anaerolineaceae bacterium]